MATVQLPAGLSGTGAQRVFRTTLGAISRPGSVHRLDVPEALTDVPPVILPALAIADVETEVLVVGSDVDVRNRSTALLRRTTGARSARDIPSADIVVALDEPTPDDVLAMRAGTAVAPEHGARVFVACRQIEEIEDRGAPSDATGLWLIGPGASSGRGVRVDGVGALFFEALVQMNTGGPVGVDTWLVDDAGSICAVPRSSSLHLIAGDR